MKKERCRIGGVSGRGAAALLALSLALLLPAAGAVAHGGRPLKLGTLEDGQLTAAVEVMRVFLLEEIGLSVKYVPYEEIDGLLGDFDSKKVEMILLSPVGESIDLGCSGAEGGDEGSSARIGAHYRKIFPGAWVGLTRLAAPRTPCAFTAVVLHREIVGNLHLSTLGPALEKLFGLLTTEDLEVVRREGSGGRRERAAAIRRLLKAKGLY